jgi:hypothetical protein
MTKPKTIDGYSDAHTADCERVLVTLLRGLGPWAKSVYLVGGLTPRYLIPQRPPHVPPHAGTLDVDVVIDLQILANTDAYRSLEENLKRLGFERSENAVGKKISWRWQTQTEHGAKMILEFLADDPEHSGGRVQPLPTVGNISALNIPHSSMVFDLYEEVEIRAELLGENGIAAVTVRHADIVSFTCLKAFAYEDRGEPKDVHDLIYCIENHPGGIDAVAGAINRHLQGQHGMTIRAALDILRRRFASEADLEGYRKDGPVAVAKFELGSDAELREPRLLRQREASDLIEQLLARISP